MSDLKLRDISLWAGGRQIIDRVSFVIPSAAAVGLVGESGAGKTSLGKAVIGLWPGRLEGEICWGETELTGLAETEYRRLRGNEIVFMPQDPIGALNPVLTIGRQMGELLRVKRRLPAIEARHAVLEWLKRVDLKPVEKIAGHYVHQISGGMAQRVLIAMAMSCGPKLLIADEPFSSLDPATASQEADLLIRMRAEYGFSLLLITHDLDLAQALCREIVVLKGGRAVEAGPVEEVFGRPANEYTRRLVDAAGLDAASGRV